LYSFRLTLKINREVDNDDLIIIINNEDKVEILNSYDIKEVSGSTSKIPEELEEKETKNEITTRFGRVVK